MNRRSWQTWEFWVSQIPQVLSVAVASGFLDWIPDSMTDQIVGLVGSIVAAIVTSATRTVQKRSTGSVVPG